MALNSADAPNVLVVVHHDELTPRDFVTALLVDVFGMTSTGARHMAEKAQRDGSAVVAILPDEKAAELVGMANERIALHSHPLSLTLKPAPAALAAQSSRAPDDATRYSMNTAGFGATLAWSFRNGMRALFLRHFETQPAALHGGAVVAIALLGLFIEICSGWIANRTISLPNTWGFTSLAASTAILAGGLLVLAGGRRSFDPIGAFALLASAIILSSILITPLLLIGSWPSNEDEYSIAMLAQLAVLVLLLIWWLAVIATAGARLLPTRRVRGAVGLVAISLLAEFLLPSHPIVRSTLHSDTSPGLISFAFDLLRPQEEERTYPPPIDVEGTYARQRDLVTAEVDRLLPSRKDRSEFYFVSMGTYAGQDVFLREARSAREIFDERMGTRGRSILLANNRETIDTLPLANATNLDHVLQRLATVMNVEKDVLVLFLTSHGTQESLAVSFGRFSFNDLTPVRLKTILDRSGVRNKVIIVSACHSGTFIPTLADKSTMIITAAHAERTSFGCSNEREWTYFGDAFFNQALREHRSLTDAFEAAKARILHWEQRDKLTPSEPQIWVGEDIGARIRLITAALDKAGTGTPSLEARNELAPAAVPVEKRQTAQP